MFFRHSASKPISFQGRLNALQEAGFQVKDLGDGRAEAKRDCCAVIAQEVKGGQPRIEHSGILYGSEIATLVDGGFMKVLETPSGLRRPALASDLKRLQAFQEDLREALGIESLYNQSLGTVCDSHQYDRLSGR